MDFHTLRKGNFSTKGSELLARSHRPSSIGKPTGRREIKESESGLSVTRTLWGKAGPEQAGKAPCQHLWNRAVEWEIDRGEKSTPLPLDTRFSKLSERSQECANAVTCVLM